MSMKNLRSELPPMCFLDFETTGLDPVADRPTEVCAVRVVEGEVTSVFNTLVYYDGEWTPGLQRKGNHHTPEDLRRGMKEYNVAGMLYSMIDPDDILVAYNALFDFQFLIQLWFRHLEDRPFDYPFIDPLTIARDVSPYPHKLGDMCKKLGISLPEAHLAYDDTMALVELTLKLHEEYDILPYLNVAGYKAQYGVPTWTPAHATLKPQGNVSVYHTEGGQVVKTKSVKPKLRKAGK